MEDAALSNFSLLNIEERPININKETTDQLLKQKEPAGCIAVYHFYYYTAIWQKTNQPHATVDYIAKGLKIGVDKVRRIRKILLDMGLIEDIKLTENGRIFSRCVRVNYYQAFPYSGKSLVRKTQSKTTYSNNTKTVAGKPAHGLSIFDENTLNTFDEGIAKKLIELLLSKRKIMRQVNTKNWIRVFNNMRSKGNISKERITKVMDWYVQHFGEQYLPLAYSAQTFSDKFFVMETMMERNQDVVVTEAAQDLLQRLKEGIGDWPKVEEKELLKSIQISLDNYGVFFNKFTTFLQHADINSRICSFGQSFKDEYDLHPDVFITEWFKRIYRKISGWEDWSGNILSMAFKEDSQSWIQFGRSYAEQYANCPDLFNQMMAAINEDRKTQ